MLSFRSHVLAVCLSATALQVAAAEVHDCSGYETRADAIPEPWESHTRTFANGAVRIAVLDTIEPAAAAFHLLVLSPPFDEVGGRQCRVVSFDAGASLGYSSLSLKGLVAGYDPALGLTIEVPVTVFNPVSGLFDPGSLFVTINQSTGEVTAEDIGS